MEPVCLFSTVLTSPFDTSCVKTLECLYLQETCSICLVYETTIYLSKSGASWGIVLVQLYTFSEIFEKSSVSRHTQCTHFGGNHHNDKSSTVMECSTPQYHISGANQAHIYDFNPIDHSINRAAACGFQMEVHGCICQTLWLECSI